MADGHTKYHHGDLEQALLSLALEAIEEDGPDKLSLRDLARRAGVSPNAPYRHFESREALLAAVANHGLEQLARHLEACEHEPEELEAMGDAYIEFATRQPGLFRLMFSVAAAPKPGSGVRAMEILGQAVSRRLPADSASHEITQAALAAWCLVHGAAVLHLDRRLDWADPSSFRMAELRASLSKLTENPSREIR